MKIAILEWAKAETLKNSNLRLGLVHQWLLLGGNLRLVGARESNDVQVKHPTIVHDNEIGHNGSVSFHIDPLNILEVEPNNNGSGVNKSFRLRFAVPNPLGGHSGVDPQRIRRGELKSQLTGGRGDSKIPVSPLSLKSG